ncbi:MAG TPA: LysR family transcriptional regulator [Streptosporangiaceae bacterium]|jgi:DNA-binding transcriptional LysR family regulator
MLDVHRLRLLRELDRRGTIAAVAEALAYTPSAVSQQLAVLEREAGVPLLERSGRRVVLTAAGADLARRADDVLALLEQAAAAVAAGRTGLTGRLRVGAFPSAVRTMLPRALVALGREHPGLELTVTELDPSAVPAALRSGDLDVGLIQEYDYVPAEMDPALDTVLLLAETIFLAVPAAAPPASLLADCRDAQWIAGTEGTLCRLMTVRACQAAGFTPRVRHHADDFATVLALVAGGQGVALVPQLGTEGVPAGVALIPLDARRRSHIACRRGARRHPAVAACAAAIRAAAAAHPVTAGSVQPGPVCQG